MKCLRIVQQFSNTVWADVVHTTNLLELLRHNFHIEWHIFSSGSTRSSQFYNWTLHCIDSFKTAPALSLHKVELSRSTYKILQTEMKGYGISSSWCRWKNTCQVGEGCQIITQLITFTSYHILFSKFRYPWTFQRWGNLYHSDLS